MKLSAFLEEDMIVSDGEFSALGYVDSHVPDTLVYCDNIHYIRKATANPNVTCIITTPELIDATGRMAGTASSVNPRTTFYKLHNTIISKEMPQVLPMYGVGQNCRIHPSANISSRARIGNHVTISENVTIKDEVEIGDNCFIDANAVIGAEGLLYYIENGEVHFIKHAGGVRIGMHVTILSGAVVVKSVHDSLLTTIGNRSIIGVSTNIGHEAIIGNNCIISSNCVIARRARLEDGARIGPSVTIREHVSIGKKAHIRLGSTVIEDVKANQSISGDFAVDHLTNLKSYHQKKHNLKG